MRLNGQDAGVYYVTGGWNEYWLAKSGREVSQLVGELDYQTGNDIFPYVWDGVWNWKYYVSGRDKKLPNSYYLKQFLDAVNKSTGDNFAREAGKVLNIDSLVRWKSISILMNSYHTDDYHNWRIWLDPGTLKFEMIPVDRSISLLYDEPVSWPFLLDGAIDRLSSQIHSSPEVSLAVDRTLWEYVNDDSELEDDLSYWDDLTRRLLPQMYADRNKHFGNISLRKIGLMRQKIISQFDNIRTYLTYEDLRLEIIQSEDKRILLISSYQPTQVELTELTVDDQKIDFKDKLLFSPQLTTQERAISEEGEIFKFDRVPGMIEIPIECSSGCRVQVEGKNLVTGAIQRVSI